MPSTVPQCQCVVEPDRQIDDPTGATAEPRTGRSGTVPQPSTTPTVHQPPPMRMNEKSLPGNDDAAKLPIHEPSQPFTDAPAPPQCPALTKPPCTEKPIEQRTLLLMM